MPAMVGTINLNVMSGIFNIGDVQTIAPAQFIKIFAGGGSFITGENVNINNGSSVVNIYDTGVYEQAFLPAQKAQTDVPVNTVNTLNT